MKKQYEADIKLDAYEQSIEDNFDKIKKYPDNLVEEKKTQAKEAAAAYRLKREHHVSISIADEDLDNIKVMAKKAGLSYQTFISKILHQYSLGRLIEA